MGEQKDPDDEYCENRDKELLCSHVSCSCNPLYFEIVDCVLHFHFDKKNVAGWMKELHTAPPATIIHEFLYNGLQEVAGVCPARKLAISINNRYDRCTCIGR